MSKTIPRAQGYNYNLKMKSPFNYKNQSTQPVAGSKLGSRIYQSKLESRLLNNPKTIDVNNDDKDEVYFINLKADVSNVNKII